MTIKQVNEIACQIIAHAGDSKSYSMEAIENAENRAFDLAEMNLAQSDEAIKRDPGCIPASMMLIHASNHLSGAELTNELAKRFVRVYQTR